MVSFLPLHFYLENKRCIYVFMWCCLLQVYSLFGEFDFSLMMKVKQFTLNSCVEQFTEVWANAPAAPCSVPLERRGGGKKDVL